MTDDQQPDQANSAASGPDIPPDRLAINPRSPHYGDELLTRGIGINFRGARKHNIEEYCISEGWVKVQAGKTMDRKGNPLLIKLNGEVEAWFEDLGDDAPKIAKSA
ncbi:DUF3297 family protein [Parasphingorhabdus sp.]|jgi:hypothetical protein|uniref:DUF3297 family protein n=1 Tax=Parasphingorhabdus sp. TaxID=2709688 RepID=UPI001B5A57CF|nr:DUF3297 family protein [Parasphingorhabdus sp.]MBQ0771777.1 DUF3297 family protein [Sphingomonadales bacterium]|tara:strand:- start:3065 stop:3382 length:318 start_codon:yes stop_codon:yes gene_type:complete